MLLYEKLSKELVDGEAWKISVTNTDEIQFLVVDPRSTIKTHGHKKGQWEIWILCETKEAFFCDIGKKHKFVNHSGKATNVIAVKGKEKIKEEDLKYFLSYFSINSLKEGDVEIN